MRRGERRTEHERLALICMTVLLVAQFLFGIWLGSGKHGYHVDETVTYEIAAMKEGRLARAEGMLDTWRSREAYQAVLNIDEEERFNYAIPYENTAMDVHPPLYYLLLHTVTSAFPTLPWQWQSMILNMVFWLASSVLLYLLAKEVTKSQAVALVTTAFWAWSVGSANVLVFVRMYMVLTAWSLLLMLLHVKLCEKILRGEKPGWRMWLGLLLTTTAGVMTQYYFLIYCFFLCGLLFFWLAARREWKHLVRYVAAEFGAVGLSALCFPKMLYHIFGGYRGVQAFEKFAEEGTLLGNLRTILSIISRQLFNGWAFELTALVLGVLLLATAIRLARHIRVTRAEGTFTLTLDEQAPKEVVLSFGKEWGYLAAMAAIAGGYILIVSKVAPYLEDRYYFCIYPMLCLVAADLLFKAGKTILGSRRGTCIAVATLLLCVNLAGFRQQGVRYQFMDYGQRTEMLEEYADLPVILLNYATYHSATDIWMFELEMYEEVYCCSFGKPESMIRAAETKNLKDGFLLYLIDKTFSDEELKEYMEQYIPIGSCRLLTDIKSQVYYCELEAAP